MSGLIAVTSHFASGPGAGRAIRSPPTTPFQLVYEQRTWSPYTQEGADNGNAFYGTKGMLVLGKHAGWTLYRERNEKTDEMRATIDSAAHHRNWLDRIRDGGTPNADIEIGHLSSSLSHLANLAIRVGRSIRLNPQAERIVDDADADALLGRRYRDGGHWAVPKGV